MTDSEPDKQKPDHLDSSSSDEENERQGKKNRKSNGSEHEYKSRHRERDHERRREKTRDKEREKERSRDCGRDDKRSRRSLSRSSRRDREGKKSDRDKDRDEERRRDRDRYRERDRDRDRDRSRRTRSESRRRERRRRSPSRDSESRDRHQKQRQQNGERGERRERERERVNERERENDRQRDSSGPQPVTLKDIIGANPGISLPEAVARLNAHNSALARGEAPPPLSGLLPGNLTLPSTSFGLVGENGIISKPHREIYVGNLPPGITVPQLAEFLNAAMKKLGFSSDNNAVVTAWVSPDGNYAFVELRSAEEATAALGALNGIQVGMYTLRVGRPKGYSESATSSSVAVPMQTSIVIPTGAPGLGAANPLLASIGMAITMPSHITSAVTSPTEGMSNVVMVSNIPLFLTEQDIKDLFVPFGELRAFNLIKSATETQSAAMEFVNPAITDVVIEGMNGLDIGGSKISLQKVPSSSASLLLKSTLTNATSSPAFITPVPPIVPTTVVRLANMTCAEDLVDDIAYEELIEDVAEECNKHSTVKSLAIPRGNKGEGDDPSIGKIFVHFSDCEGAIRALKAVAGRRFNGKIVEADFFPEDLYLKKIYNELSANIDPVPQEDLD